MLKIHDMMLDLIVWWEVSKRPKGKISETISRLKKNEPFKSAGDLRSRYKRFIKKHCEEGVAAPDKPEVVLEFDGTGLRVDFDDAVWVMLAVKRLRAAPLNAARLNSLVDFVKTFEARFCAVAVARRELEAVTDPEMRAARQAAVETEHDALRKELGLAPRAARLRVIDDVAVGRSLAWSRLN
jgi:hypothetical protein